MLFSLSVIFLASLLVYSISSKHPKPTCTVPQQPAVCINEDVEEAINAIAEYAIALSRRADALSKAARAEADPVKASKLRADAARLYAQSASQALKASKLANKTRR